MLGGAWLLGEARSSLFPTGWLLPAVLVASGALMVARRRFDLVAVLFGGLTLAVFQLDLAVYLDGAALGVDNPGRVRRDDPGRRPGARAARPAPPFRS